MWLWTAILAACLACAGLIVFAPAAGLALLVAIPVSAWLFTSREKARDRALPLAIALVCIVPTTALPEASPLRVGVPILAAGICLAASIRDVRAPGFTVAAFVAMTAIFAVRTPNLSENLSSLLLFALVSISFSLAASGMAPAGWRRLSRSVVVLALIAALAGILEVFGVLPRPWAGQTSVTRTGWYGETLPAIVYQNEILGSSFERAQATFGHPLPFAALLLVALALALTMPSRPWLRFGSAAILIAGLAANGSRSAILAAVVIICLAPARQMGRVRTAVVVAAIISWVLVSTTAVQDGLARLLGSGSYLHRVGAFEAVPGLLGKRPVDDVLFGGGLGVSSDYFRQGLLQADGFLAVDNQYVLTLAETGVLGLVLLGGLFVAGRGADRGVRLAVLALAMMSIIFDTLAWTSTLALIAAFAAARTGAAGRSAGGDTAAAQPASESEPDAALTSSRSEALGLLHERVTGWVTQPEWLAWS